MRLTFVPALLALSAAAQIPAPPAFEIASVKINNDFNTGNRGTWASKITAVPGSLTMRNVNMTMLVAWAWHVQRPQVTGPSAMDGQRYDILAKSDHPADRDELRLMLQGLLRERLKLATHRITKETEAMVILQPKEDNPKMAKSDLTEGEVQANKNPDGSTTIKGATLEDMMDDMSRELEMPIVDQSGLHGRYDFKVNVQKYVDALRARYATDKNVPPEAALKMGLIEEVLKGELGLRVETRKAPVEIVVVDSVEKNPIEN